MLKKKGFTLIELVVVMAIIAILAVVIIGAITVARNMSKETIHRSNAKTIQVAMESYYSRQKSYPSLASAQSFTAFKDTLETVLGTGSVILTSTPECSGSYAGGGNVTLVNGVYTIQPYDAVCTGSTGTNDAITVR